MICLQVHDARSIVHLQESEAKQNAKAGILAMDGGEARVGAGSIVKENEGPALLAGARAATGGVILKHAKAAVSGAALTEGKGQIQSW